MPKREEQALNKSAIPKGSPFFLSLLALFRITLPPRFPLEDFVFRYTQDLPHGIIESLKFRLAWH